MLTVGDQEVESGTVSIRLLSGKTRRGVQKEEFIKTLLNEIDSRQLVNAWIDIT